MLLKNCLNSVASLWNIFNLAINKTEKVPLPPTAIKFWNFEMAILKNSAYGYVSLLRSEGTKSSENYKKRSHESIKLNGFVGWCCTKSTNYQTAGNLHKKIPGIFLMAVRCLANAYQYSLRPRVFCLLMPWEDISHYIFKITWPSLFSYNKPLFLQQRLLKNTISMSER